MSFADLYLAKQHKLQKLSTAPPPNLAICIAVPCFNEPDLLASLEALWVCQPTQCAVEVLVVLNSGERTEQAALDQNKQTAKDFWAWESTHQRDTLRFYLLEEAGVRHKFAGVGNARKVGMDAAVWRLNQLNRPQGLIVGYDADSSCAPNYLVELEKFYRDQQHEAASIFYEHPIEGTAFPDAFYTGIIDYELHLRYFVQAQKWAGLPFAFHTVGSSFAVKAFAYCKYGGMNKKKAGEDFYFLQKFIPHKKYINLNATTVIPSPRPSDRVPFGTGASIKKMQEQANFRYETYNFDAFVYIKHFIEQRHRFYKKTFADLDLSDIAPSILTFLCENDFPDELEKINEHSPNLSIFDDRFFQWWSAFRVIKYLNWLHLGQLAREPIEQATAKLFREIQPALNCGGAKEQLLAIREIDRKA